MIETLIIMTLIVLLIVTVVILGGVVSLPEHKILPDPVYTWTEETETEYITTNVDHQKSLIQENKKPTGKAPSCRTTSTAQAGRESFGVEGEKDKV